MTSFKPRVLVACEFSGVVRNAFIREGCDAWSCDLLPTESKGPHYRGDVLDILGDGWDLMVAHPPCTYLCSSGLHWNKRVEGRQTKTAEALAFVSSLLNAGINFIALENPVGCISTKIRKPDQIIQPWQFGHPESKSTCLWLKNLPRLVPTKILHRAAWVRCDCCDDYLCTVHKGFHVADCGCPELDKWAKRGIDPYTDGGRWDNQTPSGQNKLGPSSDRWKERAVTYSGIAEAMAKQWTPLLRTH